jgi:CheY-like chemotaxis protein
VTDVERPRVVIVADDLIWATRLDTIVRAAGAEPTLAGTPDRLRNGIAGADAALIDLGTRRMDPFEAIVAARLAGLTIVAVGPHEDLAARKRALADGASRVYAYRKLFDDGPRTIAAWLNLPAPALAPASGPDEPVAGRPSSIAPARR